MKYVKNIFLIFLIIILASTLLVSIGKETDEKPPVFLILVESTNTDHFGECYGYNRATTEEICDVAEDGVLFTNAYSQGTSTPKSVPALLASKTPREHGFKQFNESLSSNLTTIFEVVNNQYNVTFLNKDYRLIESNIDQGAEYYVGFSEENLRNLNYENRFSFLFLQHPHAPYAPPIEYREWGKTNLSSESLYKIQRTDSRNLSEDQKSNLYDGELYRTSDKAGALIEEMKSDGIYQDSLIIITGDHGEMLGERGIFGHAGLPYEGNIHVPLIIKFPDNRFAGNVIQEPVRHIDVMPTILDIIGVPMNDLDLRGTSLLPLIKGEKLEVEVFSANEPRKGWVLRTQNHSYLLGNPEIGCKDKERAKEFMINRPGKGISRITDKNTSDLRERLCEIYEPSKYYGSRPMEPSPRLRKRLRELGYLN